MRHTVRRGKEIELLRQTGKGADSIAHGNRRPHPLFRGFLASKDVEAELVDA
jgi:hypothetical protein